jgi:peptidase C39-like protein
VLTVIERPGRRALLRVPPSARAVVSWNTAAPSGEIALTAHRTDGTVSAPLQCARWSPGERRSLAGADPKTHLDLDVVHGEVALSGLGVTSTADLDAVAVTVPPARGTRVRAYARTAELDVPHVSQFTSDAAQRGWCSAASLAMLLRYHGVAADLPAVVRGVTDAAYGGTGNWAFNAAYAGARGLRGVIAYLSGIDHVAAFVDAGLPVGISLTWKPGQLTGAPVAQSGGHLLVVRGIAPAHVAVNDPAQPSKATRYARAELDALFRSHGGVAYLIAPRERTAELVALANASELAAAG